MGRSRPCSLLFRKTRFIVSIDLRFRPPPKRHRFPPLNHSVAGCFSSADIAGTSVAGLSEYRRNVSLNLNH